MDWLEALILGVVQGLTEFLPVSSSGHIELARALLGVEPSSSLLFTVVVHGATVLSTIVVLWPRIWELLRGLFRFRWNAETRYVAQLAVSMVPVALVGLLLTDWVEALFSGNILLVGAMLLVTAMLLALTYFWPRWHASAPRSGTGAPTFPSALIMGLGQAVAVLPGLSRSGTTISLGLLSGLGASHAAEFSFLMALPPIIGMNLLEALGGDFLTTTIGWQPLAVGFVAAFVTGFAACRWMLRLVRRGKLIYFALYCALVGLVAILSSIL